MYDIQQLTLIQNITGTQFSNCWKFLNSCSVILWSPHAAYEVTQDQSPTLDNIKAWIIRQLQFLLMTR